MEQAVPSQKLRVIKPHLINDEKNPVQSGWEKCMCTYCCGDKLWSLIGKRLELGRQKRVKKLYSNPHKRIRNKEIKYCMN